jgi:hypothetical protein
MSEGTVAVDGQFDFARALTLVGKLDASLALSALGPVFEPSGKDRRRR